jgi:hypothetical protein
MRAAGVRSEGLGVILSLLVYVKLQLRCFCERDSGQVDTRGSGSGSGSVNHCQGLAVAMTTGVFQLYTLRHRAHPLQHHNFAAQ